MATPEPEWNIIEHIWGLCPSDAPHLPLSLSNSNATGDENYLVIAQPNMTRASHQIARGLEHAARHPTVTKTIITIR